MAQRIASLLASSTEILYELGLGDRVVAISHECDYPSEVTRKPRVTRSRINDRQDSRAIDDEVRRMASAGSSLYEIDVQKLTELHPDLIVTQAQCEVCAVSDRDVRRAVQQEPSLKDVAIIAMNPMSMDDVFRDIQRIAAESGAGNAAGPYVSDLRRRIENIRRTTQPLKVRERPKVIGIEWIDPLMVAANWMPELIEFAGGRCELSPRGTHSSYTNWREVAEYDPDIIIIMPCGFDLNRTIGEARVLGEIGCWSALSAVKNKQVYAVDGNAYFNRCGPRLVDSVEMLAGLIQSEHFRGFREKYAHAWRSFYSEKILQK